MLFSYSARDEKGKLVTGKIRASSRETAISLLLQRGYYILSLTELEKKSSLEKVLEFFQRVRKKDLLIFWRQFSTLLSAGVPIDRSLKALYRQTKNPNLKKALSEIISDVEEGLSLSNAFAKHPYIFSDFFIQLLKAAEISGRVEQTVDYIASFLEKEVSFSKKIFHALIYPAVVILIFIGVVVLITVFVFPQLSDFFQESQVKLPWITRFFLSLGQFLTSWGLIVVIFLILLGVALINYFRTQEGKILWSELQLKLPFFGELFKKIAIVRFAKGVAILLKGGISLPTAIEMGGKITANAVFKETAFEIAEGVRRGENFSNLIASHSDLFGEIVSAMVAVGEETGKIDELLEKVAQYFQEDIDSHLAILSELIQPIIIIILGIFVGTLIGAILWPLYSLILSI